MNERGAMLIDSLLSFFIISICTLLILPLYIIMQTNVSRQLVEYRASEALLNAAKQVAVEGGSKGMYTIEQQTFQWTYDQQELCVYYTFQGEEVSRCVTSTSEASP